MTEILTASQYRALRKEAEKRDKPKKAKAKGESEHTKLLKAADKYFSLYCRATWADEYGMVKCCTCGIRKSWRESDGSMQTGHWQSRGCNATRFDFHNVGPQCRQCNYFLEGQKEKMKVWLLKMYGEGEVLRVEMAAKTQRVISNFELKALCECFKELFKEATKGKIL